MASLNKVFLLGNLTREPELQHTPGGMAVCELGMAVSRKFTLNGQQQEETCFVDVTVWGKIGLNCAKYLHKGSSAMIEGRLQLDTWEDRNGGGRRSKLKVQAEAVQFIGGRREDNGVDSQYAPERTMPPMPDMPEDDQY